MIRLPIGRGNTRVVAAATVEPLSIEQAIRHLRENEVDVDRLDLAETITDARAWVEDYTGRALAPQTLEWASSSFPGVSGFAGCSSLCTRRSYDAGQQTAWQEFELPLPPVLAIESISYLDADGIDVVMDPADYRLDYHSQPAVIYLPYGGTWPVIQSGRNAVRVRYIAGYDAAGGSPDNNPLPPVLLRAIKLMTGHFWENKEATSEAKLAEIPLGIFSMLAPWQTRIPIA